MTCNALRPSTRLEMHRDEILVLAARHRALAVMVFGSVARGQDGPGSDLDLLVRFAPEASLFDQVALVQAVEDLLGSRVDIVSEAGLGPKDDTIRAEARPL